MRIGILLSSTKANKYLYETVKNLSRPDVELFFILNQIREPEGWISKLKKLGVTGFVNKVGFRLVSEAERLLFSRATSENSEHDLTEIPHKVIDVKPRFSKSGLVVRYDVEDVSKLNSLGIDILVRGNAEGIFRGDILKVAKDGILSFHHGDNRWNRGAPPAFWEVYKRVPSTGFVIQVLSETLDGGRILKRGNFPTQATYFQNSQMLYAAANPFMSQVLERYIEAGTLVGEERSMPYDGELFRRPNFLQSLNYLAKIVWYFVHKLFREKLLQRKERWQVRYSKSTWQSLSMRNAKTIPNPPGRYFADPFVVARDDRVICFVEDYPITTQRACITAIELNSQGHQILGQVISEPFHLSFPYTFEYQGELYMVPESGEANAIRLYKCIEFPMRWEYQYDLISDIDTVDTMIFPHNGYWWLLTNPVTHGASDHTSLLAIYRSDSPLSTKWQPHRHNPVTVDCDHARNAGLLSMNGALCRVRQRQGFKSYGVGLSIAEINQLDEKGFQEQELISIRPTFDRGLSGTHHMHSCGEYTVFDCKKYERFR